MIAAGGAEGYEVSFILSNDGYVRVYADNADDEQSFAPPINMNGVVTSVHMVPFMPPIGMHRASMLPRVSIVVSRL
jgi:hypothetical protein